MMTRSTTPRSKKCSKHLLLILSPRARTKDDNKKKDGSQRLPVRSLYPHRCSRPHTIFKPQRCLPPRLKVQPVLSRQALAPTRPCSHCKSIRAAVSLIVINPAHSVSYPFVNIHLIYPANFNLSFTQCYL
jgi:hypothetical protein